MHDTSNFCENLKALKEARNLSMEVFARELGIPKSTLQGVMKGGETTLYTAKQISNASGIPLSVLMEGPISVGKLKVLRSFLTEMNWFSELNPTEQCTVAEAISIILEGLEKSCTAGKSGKAPFVRKTYSVHIISIGDGIDFPNDDCTRAQIVIFLYWAQV